MHAHTLPWRVLWSIMDKNNTYTVGEHNDRVNQNSTRARAHILVLWGLITSPKCPHFAGEVRILVLSMWHVHKHIQAQAQHVPASPLDTRNI